MRENELPGALFSLRPRVVYGYYTATPQHNGLLESRSAHIPHPPHPNCNIADPQMTIPACIVQKENSDRVARLLVICSRTETNSISHTQPPRDLARSCNENRVVELRPFVHNTNKRIPVHIPASLSTFKPSSKEMKRARAQTAIHDTFYHGPELSSPSTPQLNCPSEERGNTLPGLFFLKVIYCQCP